jgi:diguanylate cyclase (GGDEF)-like protein
MATLEKINVEQMELQGFSRSIAELEWLLLILSLLYYVSPGATIDDKWGLMLAMVLFALFTLAFHYFNFFRVETRWKLATESWAMLLFISWVVIHTGGVHSPLLNLYLLVIIASALTLGKVITLLEFVLITCVYLYMGYPIYAGETFSVSNFVQLMVMFTPFLLVGYLTTMLAADVQYGRKMLELLAETDELTGAHNRRSLGGALQRELERSIRLGKPFSLMQIDADNLKSINDSFGHEAGDKLLKNLCDIVEETSRESDTLARTGGDEFVMLLPGIDGEHAAVIGERIRKAVTNSAFDVKGNQISTTVSIGIACYPHDTDNLDELLRMADSAMYLSKQAGRNKVTRHAVTVAATG